MRSLVMRGVQEFRASVTLDNINLSNEASGGTTSWPSSGQVALSGGEWATYEVLYRTQPYIRAAVNRLATGIGRIPLPAYTDTTNDGGLVSRERLRVGPLFDLLRTPWPGRTASHLKQAFMKNALIHGFSIFVKYRGGSARNAQNPVIYLLPSSSSRWYVPIWAYDSLDQPTVYMHRSWDGTEAPFYPEDLVIFSPYTTRRQGLAESPMEALRRMLLAEDSAQRATIAAFEHGMRPSGALSYTGAMKPDAMRRTREDIDKVYGGVDNYFKYLILDNGAKYEAIDSVVVDPAMLDLRRFNREEVAAVYNIPPPAIAVLDEQKYANIREQHLMEYQDTFQPWTTLLEETLQVQLIDPEVDFAGAYVEFNFREVLRGDPIRETETLVKAAGRPVMTLNEARGTQNLRPFTAEEDPTADRVPLQLNSSTSANADSPSPQAP